MKPFHTIAIPHRDILEGKLTMDVFAADLWETYIGKAPSDYVDYDLFFNRTYITDGLRNLLDIVKKRIEGFGGDPVIQLQTPFGGGKTHSLIALMHKARKDWKAKVVVLVGTNLDAKEQTLWEVMEEQLTGKVEILRGKVSPGKEKIKNLLSQYQPLLILMDEVLQYVTKAAGVKVENSTLSAQTIAFMQELTEVVSSLEKACLVVTLPSSLIEHYDQEAERFFSQLQKVVGRMERVYTPVQEYEIAKVIRRRLFSSVDEEEAKKVVYNFIEYAEKENILPVGLEVTQYRDRFLESYPFLPDVIDVLYHRWGSIPDFQRTRGVLRLLSLVIYDLKDSNNSYISLADFDFENKDIRSELIKYIGNQYNSVLAEDITDANAGSKKVDLSVGESYKGLRLGTRTARTIFMYSFSGGHERGATMVDIKRSATTLNNPSSVIADVLDNLKEKLFYLQYQNGKYFFSSQPNLNRMLIIRMESIKDDKVEEIEKNMIKDMISQDKLKVYFWEENSFNIPDDSDFKLIILKEEKKDVIDNILRFKGEFPRVNLNVIFFLVPLESERQALLNLIRKYLAYKSLEEDKGLALNDEQRKEVKDEIKKTYNILREQLRRAYRIVLIPTKDGYKKEDLGVPTYGENKKLNVQVYEKLKGLGEILEKIEPVVIKEKYLKDKNYVFTLQILNSSYRTPGEIRFSDKDVLEKGIIKGVKDEVFGLGELENDREVCRYYGEDKTPSVSFAENEILIKKEICEEQEKEKSLPPQREEKVKERGEGINDTERPPIVSPTGEVPITTKVKEKEKIKLRFKLPEGKASDLMKIVSLIGRKFKNVEIEIRADEGSMTEDEYERIVKEAFLQLGIDFEEE